MDESRIRAAAAADAAVIGQIVEQAYRHYIPRIGKPPGPMLDDYAARISEGVVWVIEEAAAIAGIIVLLPKPDHLLLDNIAVAPARQGSGLGRRLLAFAEAEAVRRGYGEIRLYTHQTMTENQRLYIAIGYEETGRGTEAGYERVFMRKRLPG
jgi:ribosomal protein S18 acetylase RimI-like enzyme